MSHSHIEIVVLGDSVTGKSNMVLRYLQNIFESRYVPTIEDSYRKTVNIDNKSIPLNIIDTAGVERFTSMRDHYMNIGDGFLLVYSITSRSSFEEIKLLRDLIVIVKGKKDVPIIICGNKCDLTTERSVKYKEGFDLAREWNCEYCETSAKNGTNIDQVFNRLISIINDKRANLEVEPEKKRKRCVIL